MARVPPSRIIPSTLGAAMMLGCAFEGSNNPPDAPPVVDTADAPDGPPPADLTAVVAFMRGASPRVMLIPLANGELGTACPEQTPPATVFIRAVHTHPTLPLFYTVETGLHAASLTCSTMTWNGMTNVAFTRPMQQIAFDPDRRVGFFSGNGVGAIGIYRFTTDPAGLPTPAGMADTQPYSSAVALDAAQARLYVAGGGFSSSYALDGPTFDLPTGRTNAAMCMEPVALVRTGAVLLAFCTDTAEIRSYATDSYAYVGPAGTFAGNVDRVVVLPGDRAVAARATPAELVLVALGAGTPVLTTGPGLTARATAIAASSDGKVVLTSSPVGTDQSELATWRVDAVGITPIARRVIDGTVSALSVAPGL